MSIVVAALVPVALMIGLGTALHRLGLLEAAGWAALERLVYYVLFPILLFRELVHAELSGLPILPLAAVLVGTQLAMALTALVLRRFLTLGTPAFTSLLQGVVRWNSYVGIALAPLLFGAAAPPLMALAVIVLTPLANVLSVTAMASHAERQGGGRRIAGHLATNPLIIAPLMGAAWSWSGLGLAPVIDETMAVLGRATLACGLLVVGAGLRPVRLTINAGPLLAALAGKLILSPLIALGLAHLIGLEDLATGVALLALAVPTSSSSYILARMLHGDADLMAAIISLQTILAFLTLPLVLSLGAP